MVATHTCCRIINSGSMKYELYTWQQEAIDAWRNNDNKGTVMATTGSGKTRVATTIIRDWMTDARIKGENFGIVVIVPTAKLMDQWYHELLNMGIDRVGRYGGKHKENYLKVIVSVVNSARKLMLSNDNTLLICDEAHRLATERNKTIFNTIRHEAILGLSATPDRADGLDVTKFTGKIVYRLGYKQAVADGVIPEFTVNVIRTQLSGIERAEYQHHTKSVATFASKIAEVWGNVSPMTISPELDENVIFWRNACHARKRAVNSSEERFKVLDYLIEKHKGEKIAVFHESIEDIEKVAHKYHEQGYNVDVYHSESENGDKDFMRWCDSISSEGRILFSCKALKEGINVPSMEVVIMVSGTNDARSRIQTLGRALRGSAATTYLMYAFGTTDRYGWQQMRDVGEIPEDFIVQYSWSPSLEGLIKTTPEKVTSLPTIEELQEQLDKLKAEIASAQEKINNQQTQIETCAQPVPPDQTQEMIE